VVAERGQQTFVSIPLGASSQRIAVSASEPCHLVFVGYDD
jgi:hypothetical protein